jgi:multidrug efflux pump subunit AcrB
MKGNKVPLKEIAEIKAMTGPAFIYRDNNKRFVAIKFSIRERDLGSTIAEAQEKVNAKVEILKVIASPGVENLKIKYGRRKDLRSSAHLSRPDIFSTLCRLRQC